MLQTADVVTAYRLILGREPENEAAVAYMAREPSLESLAARLMTSDEFRRRAVYGMLEGVKSQWVCAEIRHGLKLWVDLLDAGVAAGVLQDNWEPDETGFILSVLKPGDGFIDIGANVGWFTVLAAATVGPSGHVHAFEPRTDIHERLTASVEINGFTDRCTLHSCALGADPGEMTLASVPSENNPGHSFLVPGQLPEGAVTIGRVPIHRLDERGIECPIRLIKVDVEGAEYMVMRGACALLRRDRPIIVSEVFPRWMRAVSGVDPRSYLDFLRTFGYRIFHLSDGGIGREIHSLPHDVTMNDEVYFNIVAIAEEDTKNFLQGFLDDRVANLENFMENALSTEKARTSREIGALTEELDQTRAQAASLTEELDQTHAQSASLTEELDQTRAQSASLTEELDQTRAQAASLTEELDQTRAQAASLTEELDQTRAQAASLTNENGVMRLERELANAEYQARIHKLSIDYRQLSDELEQVRCQSRHAQEVSDRIIFDLQAAFDDRGGLMQRQITKIEQLTQHLAALENSTFWRATGPLRRLFHILPVNMRANARRSAMAIWWTVSFQLPTRLRERTAQPDLVPSARRLTPELAVPLMVSAQNPVTLQLAERPVAMIIDDRWPQPDRDGGSIDAVNIVKGLLLMGYEVVFAATAEFSTTGQYLDDLKALGVRCLGPDDADSIQAFIEMHGTLVSVYVLTRYTAGGQFLELIRYNCPDAKIVFNTLDLHFLREEREARLLGDTTRLLAAANTRDREEFLVHRSDATIVVSSVEQTLLINAVPGAYVVHLPLARTEQPPQRSFAQRRHIGFIGGFDHAPNVDAVRYFASEIWPLIRGRLPGCRFSIVGSRLPETVQQELSSDIDYLGHLPDVSGWFDELRISVAPLRYGAGTKGKVVSSLSAGVPCVGTPIAIEGMSVVVGQDILSADTPDAFADNVVALYQDETLWQRLSEAGRIYVERENSMPAYMKRLHEMLIHIGLPCITPP